MRDDVKNLLQQIGQPEFPYRDFDNGRAPEQHGYWPLFEAVALHPVIARREWVRVRRGARDDRRAAEGRPAGTMFSAYDAPPPPPAPAESPAKPGDDVRGLLRRLSDQIK